MPLTGYAPVSRRRCIVSNETRRRRSILKGREPGLGDLRSRGCDAAIVDCARAWQQSIKNLDRRVEQIAHTAFG